MKTLILFLLSFIGLWAQVSFTPSACTMTIQKWGPYPKPCKFTLTGSGMVSLQNAAFTPGWHWWDVDGTEISSITVSGSADIFLSCYYCDQMAVGTHTPDFQPAKIGATEVPATLIVEKTLLPFYSNYSRIKEADLSACSKSANIFRDLKDTCDLESQALGFYTPPDKGDSYNDQVFGTPIYLIAKIWNEYAVLNEFNLPGGDDRYVTTVNQVADDLGNDITDETGIYSLTTKAKVYKTPCEQDSNCGGTQFSNIYWDRLYFIGTSGTYQYTLGSNAPDLDADGIIYTVPDGNLTDTGGSATLTKEDYLVTYELSKSFGSNTVVAGTFTTDDALINMDAGKILILQGCDDNGLNNSWVIQTKTTSLTGTIDTGLSGTCSIAILYDKIAVIDLANQTTVLRVGFETLPYQPVYPRTIHISDRDKQTGKWYVINEVDYSFPSQPALGAAVLSFKEGDTNLTFEYLGPLNRGTPNADTGECTTDLADQQRCFTTAHSTELLVNGIAYFLHQDNTQESNGEDFVAAISAQRLSAKNSAAYSALLGGGFAFWNLALDHMGGARLGPFIASNGDNTTAPISSYRITSYSGNEATVTPDHNFATNDTVIISVADASTTDQTLNGSYTATVTAANKFTTSKTPSSYQANSAMAYKAVDDTNIGNGYNEIQVCRVMPWGDILQCYRIAKHLSSIFPNSTYTADAYRDQPHVMLSPDGKYVGWVSNFMRGNRDYMYVAETGFEGPLEPDQFTPTTRVVAQPSDTSVLFKATVPEIGQDYTVYVATKRGLDSPATETAPGTQWTAEGVVVTGLTQGTTYYWVAVSEDEHFAAAGFVTTHATYTGNGTLGMKAKTPSGATEATIQYGATTSLGSETDPVSCTVGDQCEVRFSYTKGDVVYMKLVFDSGDESPIVSQVAK